MAIEFHCPTCEKKLKTGDDKAGKSARCPGCGTTITVPSPRDDADDDFSDFGSIGDFGAAPAALPPRRTTAGRKQIACPMCGANNDPGASHCYACGEDLHSAAVAAGSAEAAPFDVGDQFSKGLELFKAELGLCVGTTVLYLLAPGGINFVLGLMVGGVMAALAGGGADPAVVEMLQQVVQIPAFFVQVFFDAGYTLFILNLLHGRRAEVGDVFAGGKYFLSLALNRFLLFLAIFVPLIPAAIPFAILVIQNPADPSLLLIVALILGMIGLVISMALYVVFWPYCWIIVDRNPGGITPLKASMHLTKGEYGPIVLMGILYWALTVAGTLACCVGMFFTVPIANLMVGIGYDRLIRAKGLGT